MPGFIEVMVLKNCDIFAIDLFAIVPAMEKQSWLGGKMKDKQITWRGLAAIREAPGPPQSPE